MVTKTYFNHVYDGCFFKIFAKSVVGFKSVFISKGVKGVRILECFLLVCSFDYPGPRYLCENGSGGLILPSHALCGTKNNGFFICLSQVLFICHYTVLIVDL